MEGKPPLLIVDDDAIIRDLLCSFFDDEFAVVGAQNLDEVKSALAQMRTPPAYALVDLGLPPAPHRPDGGFAAIRSIQAIAPECAIVVVSGQNARRHAAQARLLGACDYVEKPCQPSELRRTLLTSRDALLAARRDMGLVGESPAITRLREQIKLIAETPYPVLITGETGSGKELVARALHAGSRPGKPFWALNCASIPQDLMEPTLFGNAKNAFTGAAENKGMLGDVADGTLFLDEIGDLPESAQANLLRVLETGEYRRVGETRTRQSPARIVAASNKPLRNGNMREDLYHRISVFAVNVPPVREMGDDRFLLLDYFAGRIAADRKTPVFELSRAAKALWRRYPFAGNVRELRNITARLQVKYPGQNISAAQMQDEMCETVPAKCADDYPNACAAFAREQLTGDAPMTLPAMMREIRAAFVKEAVQQHGNETKAAAALGVGVKSLRAANNNKNNNDNDNNGSGE